MLSAYMRRMRNNNLEIRIAGPSWRPQLDVQDVKWILFKRTTISHSYLGKKNMVYKIFQKRNGQQIPHT